MRVPKVCSESNRIPAGSKSGRQTMKHASGPSHGRFYPGDVTIVRNRKTTENHCPITPMTTTTCETTTQRVGNLAGKYLTFRLSGESYGLSVLKIREIIRLPDITAVAQMPDYVRGVINLRGKIIPVVDMRVKFGMGAAAATERTCIIVVRVQTANQAIQMGLVVDDVEEVINIAGNDIEETPDFGAKVDTDYILGMAKIKGRVKTLLDIDRVVSAEAAEQLHAAASN